MDLLSATHTVVLFLGLPIVQLLIGEGRPGPFYHVNDVSVYLARQRGEGVPNRKNAFCACILHFEPEAVHSRNETTYMAHTLFCIPLAL